MVLVLLFLSLSQSAGLDSVASAFADGDASARPELAAAGPHAVLPLRAVRRRSPARVDALIREIKAEGASGGGAAELLARLSESWSPAVPGLRFREAFSILAGELPCLYDPAFTDEVLDRRIEILRDRIPGWDLLDELAAQAGVDWGVFQGHVLFSRPERLWPPGPPPEAPAATPAELEAARAGVARLGSDDPAEREAAAEELASMGGAAEPPLVEGARGADAERAARCRDLLARFRAARPAGAFRPLPAGLRGALGGFRVTLRCSYQPVDDFLLRLLLGPAGLAHEFRGEAPAGRVFADLVDVPADAALALLCRAWDLDARLEEGRVVVGSRRLAVLR